MKLILRKLVIKNSEVQDILMFVDYLRLVEHLTPYRRLDVWRTKDSFFFSSVYWRQHVIKVTHPFVFPLLDVVSGNHRIERQIFHQLSEVLMNV